MTVTVQLGSLALGGSSDVTDEYGTRWCASTWPGPGSPSSSLGLTQKTAAPGAWVNPGQMQNRSVPVNGWMVAQSPAELRRAFDRLNEACAVQAPTPLQVTVDGDTRWLLVLRQSDVVPSSINDVAAKWSIQVVAADPRWFADAVSDSTGLPSSVGGFTFPHSFPFSIDATVVSGSVSLTNPGKIAGPVVVRVDGPCTGPIITHTGSGRRLRLGTDLTLGDGEFVTVDMENELVLAQGQARRNGWVVERGWSQFTPGTNTWLFTSAGSYNSRARMSVMAWPAWQ